MAASQPFGISCKGGLNTNLNQLEMLAQPGLATKLINFEVDPDGGYRRVNGYTSFGDTRPNGNNKILGLEVYADGLIVCSGDGVFFSVDGASWLQINRASVAGTGDNYTAFTGRGFDARTSQKQSSFALYEGNTDYGQIVICDGVNKPFYFHMEGTGSLTTRTFFAEEITVTGTTAPTTCVVHDHHLVVAGADAAKDTIYYSKNFTPEDFTGTGSGVIKLADQVIGLKSFRDDLIIFCRNSLHKLININNASTIEIVPITQNVGCLSEDSIQEIGGDLVFLSPDGIRSVAGTSRIGDVELGSVSRQIQSITSTLAKSVDTYTIASSVLRSKSQYRLFYTIDGESSKVSKGIIGTLTSNGFEWSETKGIQATAFMSGFSSTGVEREFHGDLDGYVYNHDEGNSFYEGGAAFNVDAQYSTPNYDFGDIGTRKTLHYAKISITPEGEVQPTLRVRYDYEDTSIPQPPDYVLDAVPLPAIFGASIFGTAIFGASNDPMLRQAIQGSGHSCSFRISSKDQNAPYAINGIYINYVPAGRR
jgi:hypothetical protein|tara:strand:- start:270 stop:1871 length:1602 start_codon:yes stop_codon:yes gene_type:complete